MAKILTLPAVNWPIKISNWLLKIFKPLPSIIYRMKFQSLFLLPFFILITTAVFSQEKSFVTKKTAKSKAVKFFKQGFEMTMNYKDDQAIKYFEKALKIEPNFIDVHIRLGGIYNERNQYAKSEEALERVNELAPDYQKNVPFLLGIVEMKQEKYGEAAEHFQQYLDAGPKNERTKEKASRFAQNCLFISKALANPVPFQPENLGPNVNTENAEYLPSITADGENLIFTRLLNRQNEDFFISQKDGDSWKEAVPMEDINTLQNEGAQTVSADGRLLVFTACNRGDGYGSCDLYFSEVRSGRWTPPANIGRPLNTGAWESQPSLSADGKTLYFSSDRKGSKGGRDIWYSTRKADGSWEQPVNLKGPINTSQSEESPFIHPDNQTLYFMSNGHPGMGSQDLFLSRRNEKGVFGTPQNLGYPINTEGHEGALFVDLEGRMAYFSTDREFDYENSGETKRRRNHTDIYRFELHEAAKPQPVTYVKAEVIDANTYFPLVANIEFIDLETGNTFSNAFTNQKGEFLVCLPLGKDYALNVSKEDYLFHSENFSLSQQQKREDPFLLTIKLQPISKDEAASNVPSKPVVLKNVFFESGSAELLPTSVSELNRLKTLLESNPSLSIRINGHTDNIGNDQDNKTLSQNRAKAVYDFLIAQGIKAARLSYQGFGETKPIDTNETEEGRQNNRRTEFEVVR